MREILAINDRAKLLSLVDIRFESPHGDVHPHASIHFNLGYADHPASAQLTGTSGDDVLTGTGGDDVLRGLEGQDTLITGGGADIVYGGGGDDITEFSAPGQAQVFGGEGFDRIQMGQEQFAYGLSPGNDGLTIHLRESELILSGVERVDFTAASGFVWLAFHIGQDVGETLDFRTYSDTLAAAIFAGQGDDILYGMRSTPTILVAGGGDDMIYGGNGGDILDIGFGTNAAYGGQGNDQFLLRQAEAGQSVYGGAGQDSVSLDSLGAVAGHFVDLSAGVILDGYGQTHSLDSIESFFGGTGFADEIIGTEGANRLITRGLQGQIFAGGGDDHVLAEGGGLYDGGDGIDTLEVTVDDTIWHNPASGTLEQLLASQGVQIDLAGAGAGTGTGLDAFGYAFEIAGFEHIQLSGQSAYRHEVSGNDLDNRLISRADGPGVTLSGRSGDDYLQSGAGDDTLYGGAGDDEALAGDGDDGLLGRGGNDNLFGEAGADRLFGQDGADFLFGGDGEDRLYGGEGQDELEGGAQDDILFGQAGQDTLFGGSGMDTLIGGGDDDTLNGGEGDDLLSGQVGNDLIQGGAGHDTMAGQAGSDILIGNDGVDVLFGGGGDDFLHGWDDADTASGGTGADTLYGGWGDDTLSGGAQDDVINGDDGADRLYGNAANDALFGGAGEDELSGQAGVDRLYGGADNDFLFGGGGSDDVYGGAGDDVIDGGSGTGNDQLWGDAGADIFVLGQGFGVDRIMDFEDGVDLIDLSGNSLAGSFADVAAAAVQLGLTVRIDLNANNTVILEDFDLADLDATDFIF